MSDIGRDESKKKIAEAIARIEKKSSAEIVAVLRATSGSYRHVDLGFGAFIAFAMLCFFLYSPEEFDFTFFPLEQAAAFILGVIGCANLPPLRRALASAKTRRRFVEQSARASFVEMGITKTRGRTGILVYLASFERDAAIVCDTGIDKEKVGVAKIEEALAAAMKAGSIDEIIKALDAFAETLGSVHPVADDDIDELPNEVAA